MLYHFQYLFLIKVCIMPTSYFDVDIVLYSIQIKELFNINYHPFFLNHLFLVNSIPAPDKNLKALTLETN